MVVLLMATESKTPFSSSPETWSVLLRCIKCVNAYWSLVVASDSGTAAEHPPCLNPAAGSRAVLKEVTPVSL